MRLWTWLWKPCRKVRGTCIRRVQWFWASGESVGLAWYDSTQKLWPPYGQDSSGLLETGYKPSFDEIANHILECWQLTCQFPTCRSPVLCSFDRDNSMYEQQTWMLTLGLLNRNTGCQCCSVRCSSMLKLLCISIHSLDFQNLKFLTFGTVKRVELRNLAKFYRNRSNRGRDIVI